MDGLRFLEQIIFIERLWRSLRHEAVPPLRPGTPDRPSGIIDSLDRLLQRSRGADRRSDGRSERGLVAGMEVW